MSTFNPENSVIVVTGGGSGVGASLCRGYARAGARSVIVADLDGDAARAIADEIASNGRTKGEAFALDVADAGAVGEMVRAVESRHGEIDLYCSNAGIMITDEPQWTAFDGTDEQWQRGIEVNVMSHVYACRAVIPSMVKRGEGALMITASAAGLLTQVGSAIYSTTKHAAVGLAESIAITHGDDGVYCSVLCPQAIDTEMIRGFEKGTATLDGVMSGEELAERTIRALGAGEFMIRPHEQVQGYFEFKAQSYDRWVGGMRKLRRKQLADTGKPI